MPVLGADVTRNGGVICCIVETMTGGGSIPVVISTIGIPSNSISVTIVTLSKITIETVTIVLDLIKAG